MLDEQRNSLCIYPDLNKSKITYRRYPVHKDTKKQFWNDLKNSMVKG